MSQVKIPTIKLNDGREIPALGYGTWLGLNDEMDLDMEEVPKMMEAMSYAIDIGYRHIDTAHLYRVEPEVGEVINRKIKEGVVKREEVFVTTKVWQHFHREADVEVSVRGSLRRLNLEYVDLVLMHWPMAINQDGVDEKIDYLETWRGFETVLRKGLAKSIGVSNFNLEQMKRLLANCKVPPVCNQVEINLNLGQEELVSFCKSKKIVTVAYSPFGTMIPSRAVPDSPQPKLDNPTMVAIAKKYGKTVTQIALRYMYERGIITIPKTVTKARVLENASIFDFALDKADLAAIKKFDIYERGVISIPKTVTKSRVLENASIFDFALDKADKETIKQFDNGYRTVRPVFWESFSNYPFDKINQKMDIPLALRVWKNGANKDID